MRNHLISTVATRTPATGVHKLAVIKNPSAILAICPAVPVAPGSGVVPAGLTVKERAVFDALVASTKGGNLAYFTILTARPQTVGYGVSDSPVGLASWILVHPGFAQWNYGADPQQPLTKATCWTTSRCTKHRVGKCRR